MLFSDISFPYEKAPPKRRRFYCAFIIFSPAGKNSGPAACYRNWREKKRARRGKGGFAKRSGLCPSVSIGTPPT